MKNKTGQKQPGFEFNWKNKLAIWLVIVFIAMAIGQRSKYRKSVIEIMLMRSCLRGMN